MGFKPGGPNPSSAAANPRDTARMFSAILARLNTLEKATSHLAANPTKQSQVVTIPPNSQLKVNGKEGTGRATIAVNLPQFINPPQGKAFNQSAAPIYHEYSYSTAPDFSENVTTHPPTTQTILPINEDPGMTLHVRVRHSFSGQPGTWGPYSRSGPVKL